MFFYAPYSSRYMSTGGSKTKKMVIFGREFSCGSLAPFSLATGWVNVQLQSRRQLWGRSYLAAAAVSTVVKVSRLEFASGMGSWARGRFGVQR
ncbi:unnamed protein product [Cuscuta epithymum]|uniref:Uncharacterized protein n=1 Tax=Cuscuta epithymum TaxID=186058 RepID=A0AAV0F3F6_9ASTE|nr:unnamed protein product [Cuscuta epithymum]